MSTLSSYSPVQQHALTRYGRLKMLQRDVLPQLDASDFRVKLTLKALYSTYQELRELGLEKEARLLTDPAAASAQTAADEGVLGERNEASVQAEQHDAG